MQTATIGSYIRDREREKDTATHTHTTTATKKKKKKGNRAQGVFRVHTKRHTVFYFFTLFCCLLLFFFCCYATKPDLLISFFFVVVIEQSLQRHLFFSLFFPRSFERKQRSDTKKGSFLENRKDVELTAHIRNTIMTLGFGSLFKITRMGTLLFLRLLSSSSFF